MLSKADWPGDSRNLRDMGSSRDVHVPPWEVFLSNPRDDTTSGSIDPSLLEYTVQPSSMQNLIPTAH